MIVELPFIGPALVPSWQEWQVAFLGMGSVVAVLFLLACLYWLAQGIAERRYRRQRAEPLMRMLDEMVEQARDREAS